MRALIYYSYLTLILEVDKIIEEIFCMKENGYGNRKIRITKNI